MRSGNDTLSSHVLYNFFQNLRTKNIYIYARYVAAGNITVCSNDDPR